MFLHSYPENIHRHELLQAPPSSPIKQHLPQRTDNHLHPPPKPSATSSIFRSSTRWYQVDSKGRSSSAALNLRWRYPSPAVAGEGACVSQWLRKSKASSQRILKRKVSISPGFSPIQNPTQPQPRHPLLSSRPLSKPHL